MLIYEDYANYLSYFFKNFPTFFDDDYIFYIERINVQNIF